MCLRAGFDLGTSLVAFKVNIQDARLKKHIRSVWFCRLVLAAVNVVIEPNVICLFVCLWLTSCLWPAPKRKCLKICLRAIVTTN